MTRPLEFRAWLNSYKTMANVVSIEFNNNQDHKNMYGGFFGDTFIAEYDKNGKVARYIGSTYGENENDVIMQFTGLLDKNGTKIFEGDIVASTYNPYNDERVITKNSVVTWGELRSSYYDDLIGAGFNLPYGAEEDLSNSEVIGNIHQNPELLK